MRRRTTGTLLVTILLSIVVSTSFASTAIALPAWRFDGMQLSGSETIAGDAVPSSFTMFGLTNTCKKMDYAMSISNFSGTGKGQVNSLSFSTCLTNAQACTIEEITAEGLPWPVSLKKVSTANYVVLSNVEIGILYGGPECALNETEVPIAGTAGALYDNGLETFTFSPASFTATGTELEAFGESVEWNGTFSTEATGGHAGEALTVS